MKVLLIRPPSFHCIETEVPEAVRRENVSYPPLSLLAIASYLTEQTHHQVKILDGLLDQIPYSQLQQQIADYAPDVMGITAFTVGLIDAHKTVQAARAVGVPHVLLGGPHVNDFPRESAEFPDIDAAVCGEGQVTLPAILEAFEQGKPIQGLPGVLTRDDAKGTDCIDRPFLSDNLDDYPLLNLKLIEYDRYYDVLGKGELFTTIITSRGCPYRCTFCNTPRDRYRTMSAKRICEEIQQKTVLGIREIYFVDDTFNISNGRVRELCEEILQQGLQFHWTARFRCKGVTRELLTLMKQAGCRRLQFGVEQGTDEALTLLQKGVTIEDIQNAFRLCREVGIRTVAYFMIGTQVEKTPKDILRTINFSISLNPDFVMYNIMTPFPGTTLFDEGLAAGVLDPKPWEEFIRSPSEDFKPQTWDQYFSPAELSKFLHHAYRKFYFRPTVVLQNLRELSSMTDFVRKARAGVLLLLPKAVLARVA